MSQDIIPRERTRRHAEGTHHDIMREGHVTSSERTVGSDDGELLVSVVVLHRLARPRVGLQPNQSSQPPL